MKDKLYRQNVIVVAFAFSVRNDSKCILWGIWSCQLDSRCS